MPSSTSKTFDRGMGLVLVIVGLQATGCVSTLDMRARGAGAPHSTIPYTGVRADAARFADYSVVDASILK